MCQLLRLIRIRSSQIGYRSSAPGGTGRVEAGVCYIKRKQTGRVLADPASLLLSSADQLDIFSRHLAALAIGEKFEADLLTFVQARKARTFNRTDMHERIGIAIVRRNKTEAFLRVEPLNCTRGHQNSFKIKGFSHPHSGGRPN